MVYNIEHGPAFELTVDGKTETKVCMTMKFDYHMDAWDYINKFNDSSYGDLYLYEAPKPSVIEIVRKNDASGREIDHRVSFYIRAYPVLREAVEA